MSLSGCRTAGPPSSIPRTLAGQPVRGKFVPPFAYEAFIRGELALARGRPQDAVAQLELATAAPDEDPYVLSRLGYAQALAGRDEESRRTLARAEAIDRCSEALWLTRAELAAARSDLEGAEAAYAKAAACAPRSLRGPRGLADVLDRRGQPARALAALERAAHDEPSSAAAAEAALELSLRAGDPAVVQHALAGLLTEAAPSARTVERAVEWALSRAHPELARWIYDHDPTPHRPELEARILEALGDRVGLRALLARTAAQDLGGPLATARLALSAGAYERADLEASSVLLGERSDEAHGLRARARGALGQLSAANEDASAIVDPVLRAELTRELLALAGDPALADELRQGSVTREGPSSGAERDSAAQ